LFNVLVFPNAHATDAADPSLRRPLTTVSFFEAGSDEIVTGSESLDRRAA